MSIFGNLLKGILGNKSDRDIKEVMPVIAQIKEEYSRITGFTNDQLRAETVRIKLMVSDYIKAEEDEIALLKERAERRNTRTIMAGTTRIILILARFPDLVFEIIRIRFLVNEFLGYIV